MPSKIIEGIRPVQELLRSGTAAESIWIADQLLRRPDIRLIKQEADKRGIPVKIVPIEVIDKKSRESRGRSPQGILAIAGSTDPQEFGGWFPKYIGEKREKNFLLLLDHIEDPQNFGAILRSAEAAGVDAVLYPKHRASPVTNTVVKASAGAAFHIPLVQVGSMRQTIIDIREENIAVIGLDIASDMNYSEFDWTGRLCLVVGSEHKGLSKPVRDACATVVKIPMRGKVESLNASAATAIVLFEAVRQRSVIQ